MRGSGGGAPSRANPYRLPQPWASADPNAHRSDRLAILPALEGSGDLCAALLKNCRTHDYEQPQSGQEYEGAQSCNHRVDPSWERLTRLDPICSRWATNCSGEAGQCSSFVLNCQEAPSASANSLKAR